MMAIDTGAVDRALGAIGTTFRLTRLYPPSHPAVLEAMRQITTALPPLAGLGTVEWKIGATGLHWHGQHLLPRNTQVAELVKAGKLRALATGSPTRIDPLPELPTVAESGYPGFEVDVWWGVFAPALTPKETVSQVAGLFARAVQAPEVKARLVALGFYPVGMCGADFAAYMRRQYDEYGRVIREANIKAE